MNSTKPELIDAQVVRQIYKYIYLRLFGDLDLDETVLN